MTSRRIIITGASGGVGRGIAIACGAVGWEVWVAARRDDESREVAAEVDAAGGIGRHVVCDVTDDDSVRAALAAATAGGPLHGIVHNATGGSWRGPTPATDYSLDELAGQFAVGVRGLYLLVRHGYPALRATRGSLLVLTSEAGFEGKAHLSNYAMVKAAQRGYMRVLARECGADGVRVNALAPLATSPALEKAFALDPSMHARVTSRIPMERVGDPVNDIGPVARFLLSDDARFVTGQTVMADGGSCPIT